MISDIHKKKLSNLILPVFICLFIMGLLLYEGSNKAYAVTYANCTEVNPDLQGICYFDSGRSKDIKCQECIDLCEDDPQSHKKSNRCKWVNGVTNDYLPVPVNNLTIVEIRK